MPLSREKESINKDAARYILLKERPDLKIKKVTEYETVFVFDVTPKEYDEKTNGPILQNPIAVSKIDGRLFRFNPMEYNLNKKKGDEKHV